jgi:hypothetical protein
MRKKHSFLLTVLSSRDEDQKLQGRLEVITTGKTTTFTNLEELLELIKAEIQIQQPDQEPAQS